MEEYMKMILKDFIESNWSSFEQFCEERGEGIAEEILVRGLGGEPE